MRVEHHSPFADNLAAIDLSQALLREGQVQVDPELPKEQLGQGAAISKVDPVAGGGARLLGLALAVEDVVVALGAGYGAGQPDLLVGGLFVDHVGADVGVYYCHDSGRIFHLDGLVLLGQCLNLRQHNLEVLVGQLMVFSVREFRGHGLGSIILDIRGARVAGVGEDAFVSGGCCREEPGSSCEGSEDSSRRDQEGSSRGRSTCAGGGEGGGGGAQASGEEACGSREGLFRHPEGMKSGNWFD